MSGISDRRPQMRLGNIVIAAAIIMQPFITGCKRVPSSIIQPEEMAQLLADIHTGESVAEQNYGEFCNDSTKRILKQSIYARHGVSEEIVDTSLMWYGHNLERYQKMRCLIWDTADAGCASAGRRAQRSFCSTTK